jgi:hypothetical protein
VSTTREASRKTEFKAVADFMDDLHSRFHRTQACRDRTIDRKSPLLVRFRVHATCKCGIAARPAELDRNDLLLVPHLVRYGPSARAVAGRVLVPERVTSGSAELKLAQRRALLALESEPGASLTRSDYERLTAVGRSQAAHDLSELVSAGRLVRVGGGRSTRYVLPYEPGAQRRWTPDRIRRELDAFCADRNAWPTANEFKTAGRGDLYVAASRYGGVAHWANELGLQRFDRARTPPAVTRAPVRGRLTWAFAGALVALVVAAAAVGAVVTTDDFLSSGGKDAGSSARLQSTPEWLQPLRGVSASKAVARPTRRVVHHVQRTPSLQTVSVRTAATSGNTFTDVARHDGGPVPLPAPTEASAPSPLRGP